MADALRKARGEINWPARTGSFDDVPASKVALELWFYLRESTDELADVMAQSGYDDGRIGKSTQKILSPSDLIEDSDCVRVVPAQERLDDALRALRAAEAEHAKSTIDERWGD